MSLDDVTDRPAKRSRRRAKKRGRAAEQAGFLADTNAALARHGNEDGSTHPPPVIRERMLRLAKARI